MLRQLVSKLAGLEGVQVVPFLFKCSCCHFRCDRVTPEQVTNSS
jgi:hypothetical protein